MAGQLARSRDRRSVNVRTVAERRGQGRDRRRCPECGGALKAESKRVAGGTVHTSRCGACGWSGSFRATDADTLMLKLSWALELEKKGGALSAELPGELVDALKLRSGDQLLLQPLVLPIGKEPMKWALSVKRRAS